MTKSPKDEGEQATRYQRQDPAAQSFDPNHGLAIALRPASVIQTAEAGAPPRSFAVG
jgi:hypothetical protein